MDAVALIQPWLGLSRWPVPEWEVTGSFVTFELSPKLIQTQDHVSDE